MMICSLQRLVVTTSSGHLLSIPMLHPTLKMALLAAAGALPEALQWALVLNPKYHPLVGSFFVRVFVLYCVLRYVCVCFVYAPH